jgi:hypothetical protein
MAPPPESSGTAELVQLLLEVIRSRNAVNLEFDARLPGARNTNVANVEQALEQGLSQLYLADARVELVVVDRSALWYP